MVGQLEHRDRCSCQTKLQWKQHQFFHSHKLWGTQCYFVSHMSGTVFAIFWGSLRAFIPSSQTTTFCVILHQNWKNCSRPPFLFIITTKNTCLNKVEQNVINFLNELSGFSVVLKLIYSVSRQHFYYWVPYSHLLATVLKHLVMCNFTFISIIIDFANWIYYLQSYQSFVQELLV